MMITAVTPARTGSERLSTGMPATLSRLSASSWCTGAWPLVFLGGAAVDVAPVLAPLAPALFDPAAPLAADGLAAVLLAPDAGLAAADAAVGAVSAAGAAPCSLSARPR